MILPIIVNTSDILTQFTSLNSNDVNVMLDNVAKGLAARYAAALEKKAGTELHQTRKRYLQNIKLVDSRKLEGTVLLDYSKDKLIKMLEEGAGPFDMKEGMLASPKVKTTKSGVRYLTIPFRFATPGALGESDVFTSRLPNPVYQVLKNKSTDIPIAGGSKSAGIALKEIPEQYQIKNTRKAITDTSGQELFKAYQNKNSIYEGAFKQKDGATGQNSYRSFRRVSENSDPDAFIHPGIEKHELIRKSLAEFNIAKEMESLLDEQFTKRGLI
jgi:hypothetical protein